MARVPNISKIFNSLERKGSHTVALNRPKTEGRGKNKNKIRHFIQFIKKIAEQVVGCLRVQNQSAEIHRIACLQSLTRPLGSQIITCCRHDRARQATCQLALVSSRNPAHRGSLGFSYLHTCL